jgi:hypothetical protein
VVSTTNQNQNDFSEKSGNEKHVAVVVTSANTTLIAQYFLNSINEN